MSAGFCPPPPKDYKLPTQFPAFGSDPTVDISLDLESFDPGIKELGPGWRRDAYPVGVGVGVREKRTKKILFKEYYPIRHKHGPNLDGEKVYEWLGDNLVWFRGKIIGANLFYEGDGLQYQGISAPLAQWTDVQGAEALIDENAYSYKLERIAQKYLKRGKITDELEGLYGPGYKYRFHEIHPGHCKTYNDGDIELPFLIEEQQEKELQSQDLMRVWDLERRLFPFIMYLRRMGQRIDVAHADRLHDIFFERRADALAGLTRAINTRGIELNADNFGKPAVLAAAFEALKIPVPKTKAGRISVTDEWLHDLCECMTKDKKGKDIDDINCGHPGRLLEQANQYDKALETFVKGYLREFVINSLIHCEFHPLRRDSDEDGKRNGTVSGRFSSSHPNLQNIPVRNEIIGPLLRACFIPYNDDMLYFSGDYSQIEFRLLVDAAVRRAKYSQTKATELWGKKQGLDIWRRLQSAYEAQKMYTNDPTTDFHNMVVAMTGLARKYAKSINFGIAFTMGKAKLAASLGVAEEKAIGILDQYHGKVPFVKAVGQAMTIESEDSGLALTLLGRRTHFDDWEPRYWKNEERAKSYPLAEAMEVYGLPKEKLKRSGTNKSLNCFTQGSGADLMKTAMVDIWDSGVLSDPADLIVSLTVHDELDGSVSPSPRGQEKLREVQHIMDKALTIEVPILTEFKQGKNWAETH